MVEEPEVEIFAIPMEEAYHYLIHGPYLEKLVVWFLIHYVPDMRLEIDREEFTKFYMKYRHLHFHGHISNEGDHYLAEMHVGEAHTESN